MAGLKDHALKDPALGSWVLFLVRVDTLEAPTVM
jgi:hypothetical protein